MISGKRRRAFGIKRAHKTSMRRPAFRALCFQCAAGAALRTYKRPLSVRSPAQTAGTSRAQILVALLASACTARRQTQH